MFRVHTINNSTLSIKNLILLFLTIIMGFASVITLAQITIPSSIDNAQQTIGRVTITSDGTASGTEFRDINYDGAGGTRISGLDEETGFSWKVLGIDDAGNLVYIFSENLVISWAGVGWWSEYWTGNWADIYNSNTGNVGIGTASMSGKLHIKSAGNTDVYIEETNPWSAANLNLKNTIRTWAIWWDSSPDLFYIGIASWSRYLTITPTGKIGIGTDTPKAQLQVSGNFIAGGYNNAVTGSYSSILWGGEDGITLNPQNKIYGTASSIWWGIGNYVSWDQWFIWWGNRNTINALYWFIWWGSFNHINWQSFWTIWWGQSNNINWYVGFIWWGNENTIEWNYNVIWWGSDNNITGWSTYSSIIWGRYNSITNSSDYSFVGGVNSNAKDDYSFVWNSDLLNKFSTTKTKTFIINATNGVGIRTNNPQGDLHVAGSGVVVFQPQTNNPQGEGCSITGSVIFSQTANKLCYCDGNSRLYVDANTTCTF